MDAFKQAEMLRMQYGGNKAWQDFFTKNNPEGSTFDEVTIKERYESEVGEEWKERLSARVEDREFDRTKFLQEREAIRAKAIEKSESRSQTPSGLQKTTSRTKDGRSASPAVSNTKKAQNEAYFARMGAENANRSGDLPPSQGGKYGGFGSEPPPTSQQTQSNMPSAQEFQSDPMAALTKGFGWFGGVVGKQAKAVNDSYLQPGFKTVRIPIMTNSTSLAINISQVASSDFAHQAKTYGVQMGQGIQTGAKGAAESFNRFVEGQDERAASQADRVNPERKDFWDSFGAPTSSVPESKPSSIGTSAMKKGTGNATKGKPEEGRGEDW